MSDAPEMPSLTVVGGPIDGYAMKMSPGTTVIVGSGRLAHMRLDHPEIELAHVKVAWDDLGISMIDNGSRKGTWVNGEPVETAALLDGDVIEFVAPSSKSTPPRLRIRIPKGSVPDPPPPPPPTPGQLAAKAEAAPARVTSARARGARHRKKRPQLPDLRLVGLAVLALVLLAGGWWLAKRLFFTAPQVESIRPPQGEPGQAVTLSGKRFDRDAGDNVVWFGDRSSNASSSTGSELQANVPPGVPPGKVSVRVETSAGRSRPVPFVAWEPLRAFTLDPPGAQPGDEVRVTGSGFAEGVTVTVGGAAAKVVAAEPAVLRFAMPEVRGSRGTLHEVVVSAGERRARPLGLHLGRVPLVVSFDPARGVTGDLVRIRGAGFAATADGNAVTFDGEPALVVAASPTEMVVVVPPGRHPQPETLASIVVQAAGRTSSDGTAFPLQRLVEAAWVPRFFAGAVGERGGSGQATVGTEIAPVMLLSSKDDGRSVPERALRVAAALNAAVDRARIGQPASFEARERPAVGIALVGSPDLLVRVTPLDAAAYETPPGLPARGAPPTPIALARHWSALLSDTFVVGTSGGKPEATAAVVPAAGAAFTQLRAALPWQYGSGLQGSRVVALSSDLKRRLREAAFRVP